MNKNHYNMEVRKVKRQLGDSGYFEALDGTFWILTQKGWTPVPSDSFELQRLIKEFDNK